MSPNLYELFDVVSGQSLLTTGFVDRNTDLLRSLAPFSVLFYTCLWTVKLSFLLFFRRLGLNVRGQKIWWWCVLVITLLTWAATVADNDWKCSVRPVYWIWLNCSTPSAIKFINHTFYANCTMDVVTDCLTIVISCIASFRQVFINAQNRRRQVRPKGGNNNNMLQGSFPWLRLPRWRFRQVVGSPFRWKSPKSSREQDSLLEEWRTPTHITPLQSIHVDPSLSVTASSFSDTGDIVDEDVRRAESFPMLLATPKRGWLPSNRHD
ncbi:MAG: hypothetical protein Q9171_006194 [Xanthocarpia ochracea]